MSANGGQLPANTDRRTRRTREALLGAFARLVVRHRYDEIRVTDILDEADVGRSTFYEHFRNKDDLLRRSLAGPFGVLAEAVTDQPELPRLAHVLAHFRENRQLARGLLRGAAAPHVYRLLRELVEARLPPRSHGLPRTLLAAQISAGQIGLLDAWLTGEATCAPDILAAAVVAGAAALTGAPRAGTADR